MQTLLLLEVRKRILAVQCSRDELMCPHLVPAFVEFLVNDLSGVREVPESTGQCSEMRSSMSPRRSASLFSPLRVSSAPHGLALALRFAQLIQSKSSTVQRGAAQYGHVHAGRIEATVSFSDETRLDESNVDTSSRIAWRS